VLREIVTVGIDTLRPYPGNARRGDVDAIAASLEANGQFQPLIVQQSTEHVLIGNHTLRAARKLKWRKIDIAYVDVDDNQARKIVLAANRTADLATYDLDALAVLLSEVDDLTGTGFTADDLAGLHDQDPAEEEPGGVSDGDGKKVRWGVVVYCADESEQLELMSMLLEEGRDCRAL
jgi:ParB-like chromosome segregation protein Spo0J